MQWNRPRAYSLSYAPEKAGSVPALRVTWKLRGGSVIGLDWRVDLAAGWAAVGHDIAVQGNLDPAVLLASPAYIRKRAQAVLEAAGGRPGHIFNLGHGILPSTPVEHVQVLAQYVHSAARRRMK